ncbi:MAG TPA: circadian clock protein KaiC [Thermoanaerobaculia bacterium]|nr:circadian clock protein KaiC [Thermoanaerobaculia bacterium]
MAGRPSPAPVLQKCPTGIRGLDEITNGGIPRGRPTLICGGPGCGKTLFGIEFLIRGAEQGEPGVFVAFEERPDELAQNVASLGFDLVRLQKQRKIFVESVAVERSEIDETGEYDLEALFLRLGDAIDSIGAKRIVLDTLETLFAGFSNEAILRAELRRLFRWLKDRGVTAIITAERGGGTLTRQGLEEYVSDCVILLDHRLADQVATRRLRVVKYRGTSHGTNEYPFLINADGVDVLPITSIGLSHEASTERISTGIADLDAMLSGGLHRGSTMLISGTAGAGKSSVTAHMARAACERGERCLLLAYEESPQQIARNMKSIGIDLNPFLRSGALRCIASRSTAFGVEMHLATIHKAVREFAPSLVILDAITNFFAIADQTEVKAMLMRLVDFLKTQQITVALTSLTGGGEALEATATGISSLIDTWLLLRDVESSGERTRVLYILKSRGTAHSNQMREFTMSSKGIRLTPPYLGSEGVLTGSARLAQEAKESVAATEQRKEAARKRRAIERRIAAIRAELEAESEQLERLSAEDRGREEQIGAERNAMAASRKSAAVSRPAMKAARIRQ